MQTNEIFLLVGEVLAQIVAASMSKDRRKRTGDTDDAAAAAAFADAESLAAARSPFADFVQEPWWDVAVPHDGTNPDDDDADAAAAAASLPGTLRALCEESSALLRRAFALALGPLPAPLELALGAEGFARVVGMFEQNNVGVRAPSPIPGVLRELLAEGGEGVVVDRQARHLGGVARREVMDEAAGLVLEIAGDGCEDDEEHEDAGGVVVSKCCGGHEGEEPSHGDEHGCCGSSVKGVEKASATAAAAAASGGCAGAAEVVEKRGGGQGEGGHGADDGRGCRPLADSEAAGEAAAGSAAAAARGRAESADGDEYDTVAVLRGSVVDDDDDDGDGVKPGEGLFAPLDGTALYSLVCCMNHSCRPNCVVRYPGRRQQQQDGKESGGRDGGGGADPLVAEVVLLVDVPAGEELTQSYVTREMGLAERRKALEDYGFLCVCPRCLEEEEAALS